MIYLIDYDRRLGRLVSMHPFADSQYEQAARQRLQLELELNRQGIQREVVLLQADSEDQLRQTHRRYFEKLADLTGDQPR